MEDKTPSQVESTPRAQDEDPRPSVYKTDGVSSPDVQEEIPKPRHSRRWFRWVLYGLVGVMFGVLDFYWEKGPSIALSTSDIGHFIFAWGFFLIPAVPLALIEFKISRSKVRAALADSLMWSVAIIAFYLYDLFELVFIGRPSRMEMHISHANDPWYSGNIKSSFFDYVVPSIAEWIGVAIAGGFIVGLCTAWLASIFAARRDKQR